MVDLSQYKVGVILSLEGCGNQRSKTGKALKACKVNIGDEQHPVTIVTSASNVRVGSRVVVAPIGSTFIDAQGAEVAIVKTSVGGVVSEGIMCDSRMLGWSGGGVGVAAQVPPSLAIGAPPPSTKPRPEGEVDPTTVGATAAATATADVGLFEKKLSKEERKKLAAEKRLARKAAKEGASDKTSNSKDKEGGEEEEEEEDEQARRDGSTAEAKSQ